MTVLEKKRQNNNRIGKLIIGILVLIYFGMYYYKRMLNVTNLLGFIMLLALVAFMFKYSEKTKPFLVFVIMSIIDYMFLEANAFRTILLDGIENTVFLNCLLIFLIVSIVYFCSNNVWISIVLLQSGVSVIGIANFYLCKFRGRGLYYSDIFSVRTAMNVTGQYDLALGRFLFVQLVCIWVIPILMIIFFVGRQRRRMGESILLRMKKMAMAIFTLVLIYNHVSLGFFGYEVSWWSLDIGKGFLLGFLLQGENYGSKADSSYAVEHIENMNQKYQTEENPVTEPADIIVVMNESFSDLGVIGDLNTNQEVMPFYKSLKNNCIKGNLYVSVLGGNTANSEYEFLTGDTMAFYKYGQVVYNSYLNHSIYSNVSYLNEKGYQTFAFHPWSLTGWNRYSAYNDLGFDQMLFLEQLNQEEIVLRHGYPSDTYDYGKVGEIYKSMPDGPRFMFNITIQNHGSYGWEPNQQISLEEDDAQNYPLATEYLSLIYESDKALEQLINEYRDSDRRVVICFFGDHQPKIEDSFIEKLYGKSLNELTLEEEQRQYITPFLIWTNYDIESEYIEKMSVNYLFAHVAKIAGLRLSPFQNYLLDLYEKYPVINALGAIDKDGNYYSSKETESIAEIKEYFNVIYNQMIDEDNTVESFFNSTN